MYECVCVLYLKMVVMKFPWWLNRMHFMWCLFVWQSSQWVILDWLHRFVGKKKFLSNDPNVNKMKTFFFAFSCKNHPIISALSVLTCQCGYTDNWVSSVVCLRSTKSKTKEKSVFHYIFQWIRCKKCIHTSRHSRWTEQKIGTVNHSSNIIQRERLMIPEAFVFTTLEWNEGEGEQIVFSILYRSQYRTVYTVDVIDFPSV